MAGTKAARLAAGVPYNRAFVRLGLATGALVDPHPDPDEWPVHEWKHRFDQIEAGAEEPSAHLVRAMRSLYRRR